MVTVVLQLRLPRDLFFQSLSYLSAPFAETYKKGTLCITTRLKSYRALSVRMLTPTSRLRRGYDAVIFPRFGTRVFVVRLRPL